jgi:hypothetical protein
MLKPKAMMLSSLDELGETQSSFSVTIVNNIPLPSYSPERYYMLSEIEHHAHSTLFLCDYESPPQNYSQGIQQSTMISENIPSSDDSNVTEIATERKNDNDKQQPQSLQQEPSVTTPMHDVPSDILLYILWNPETMESNTEAFTKGLIQQSVRKLQHLLMTAQKSSSSTVTSSRIYLVVEYLRTQTAESDSTKASSSHRSMLPTLSTLKASLSTDHIHKILDKHHHPIDNVHSPQEDDDDPENDITSIQRRAEQLARSVAMHLREDLQGVLVGISNHIRAAPGLEQILEVVSWGSKDRRRYAISSTSSVSSSSYPKSKIGIVAVHPDDLIGFQMEPDAVQGIIQSYTCAEWNGNGDHMSFAHRAHSQWCVEYNVSPVEDETQLPRPKKVRRIPRRLDEWDGTINCWKLLGNPFVQCFVVILAIWIYVILTRHKRYA